MFAHLKEKFCRFCLELIEAKNYVSPNTKTIGTGRTQNIKYQTERFFVVGSKYNLTRGSTDHRLSLKEMKFQKRHPSVIYLYTPLFILFIGFS